MAVHSNAVEDFLEKIYQTAERKGVVRVSDLVAQLRVRPPTVTRMVQKLGAKGLVRYQRYHGLTLTREGQELGRFLSARHATLEDFLRLLGCTDPETIYRDVEGMEHHVSPATLACIERFVAFAHAHPEWVAALRDQAS